MDRGAAYALVRRADSPTRASGPPFKKLCVRDRSHKRLRQRLRDRKFHGDACAKGTYVFDSQSPTALFHNPVADAQAKARAFSRWLGGEKRFQRAIQIRKTWPAVFHFDHCTRAGLVGANADALFPGETFQRVAGILEQVQQDLFDLVFMNSERRKTWRDI